MRSLAAGFLLLLALFMTVGFLRSEATFSAGATLAALLITVVLPAAGGIALLAGGAGQKRRLAGRREELRRQTLDAEVLRLAAARDGRLTVLEVATELALPVNEAAALLTSFDTRGLAEVQVTPSGMLVYSFPDIRHLGEKASGRGVLDA